MSEEYLKEIKELREEFKEIKRRFDLISKESAEGYLSTSDMCELLKIKAPALSYRISNSKKLREDVDYIFAKGKYGFKASAVAILREEFC